MRPPPQGLMVGRGAPGMRSGSDSRWWVQTQSHPLDHCGQAARQGCPSKLPFDSEFRGGSLSLCIAFFFFLD